MSELLLTILAFIGALSVLIAVHEFGHFWVARRLGVKVLRFSIGFGKVIWSRKSGKDGTEFALAAVPLGGYVKMLDEREGEVQAEEQHRAFNRQPVSKRFAIVAAGPLFNFLFAIVAYWLMFVSGVPGMKPVIGDVAPDSLAASAGLESGQIIRSVNGEPTPTWGAAMDRMLPHALRKRSVTITVESAAGSREYLLPFDRIKGEVDPNTLVDNLGLTLHQPRIPPVIGQVTAGSPAARAGIRAGDRVVSIENTPVSGWDELVQVVRENPGRPLAFGVERDNRQVVLEIRPEQVESGGVPVGRIGAAPHVDPALFEGLQAEWRHGPVAAVGESVGKTWDMITLTLRMLGEMLVGRVSTENISGPITIAVYAKASAFAGMAQFLAFLGIVSVSLGVLNLLPIPILDGGHLMFYVVETIKGSPVSETAEAVGQRIGIAVILALMGLAFYNDLARLAG